MAEIWEHSAIEKSDRARNLIIETGCKQSSRFIQTVKTTLLWVKTQSELTHNVNRDSSETGTAHWRVISCICVVGFAPAPSF